VSDSGSADHRLEITVILHGARVALSATESARIDLAITRGQVAFSTCKSGPTVDLSGCLLLPGLINAHDHLEFALFPRLGRGPYPNATAWAADIYRPAESPIREHLRVPQWVRFCWGGLKNLLCGVTLVAHHNPFHPAVFDNRFPVRVLERFGWSHSLAFSPDMCDRYQQTPPHWPFLVHAAEGVDQHARAELRRLDADGVLSARTVVVHGVGLDSEDLHIMERRRASLVWCPSSNLFTLSRTVGPTVLRSGIRVALGTDSPLTAAGDMVDEIRAARSETGIPLEEIYQMVTTRAAAVLRLGSRYGVIRDGGVADLVAVPDQGPTPAQALENLEPQLVMIAGRIRLLSERLARRVAWPLAYPIEVQGRGRYLVDVDVPALYSEASQAVAGPVSLGGKAVYV
jgi:cytosine/adenosine deaminase-related metal-dependent hydrolase